jgi:hypothetical protein
MHREGVTVGRRQRWSGSDEVGDVVDESISCGVTLFQQVWPLPVEAVGPGPGARHPADGRRAGSIYTNR